MRSLDTQATDTLQIGHNDIQIQQPLRDSPEDIMAAEGAEKTLHRTPRTAKHGKQHKGRMPKQRTEDEPEIDKDVLFSKDTFVISLDDLQMINDDVQKQVNIHRLDTEEEEQEYEEEEENIWDEDDWDDDPIHEYKETEYENPHEQTAPQNRVLPEDDSDLSLDSDAEYDNTHFLYDPPIKYKNKFILYLLKSSPVLIILIAIMVVSGMISNDTGFRIPSYSLSSSSTSFLNHKLFILEEDMKSLKKLQGLESKVTDIQNELDTLKFQVDKLEFIVPHTSDDESEHQHSQSLLQNNIHNAFDRMSELEKTVESLSKLIHEELEKKVLLSPSPPAGPVSDQESVSKGQRPGLKSGPGASRQYQTAQKYYNIANQCRILRQLTSYPSLAKIYKPKHRKSFFSKVINGFPDTLARLYHSGSLLPKRIGTTTNSQRLKLLGNMEPLSTANSPRNALLESPIMFWQNHMPSNSKSPIYFTFQLPVLQDNLKIHEVGVYHSKITPKLPNMNITEFQEMRKRWFKCAPKNMELLARLSPSTPQQTIDNLKKKLTKYHNQDLVNFQINNKKINDDQLQGWLRVGEMEYDINKNSAYQTFAWPTEVENWLAEESVQDVMIIIHSNWGDPLLVLDTVRVYAREKSVSESAYEQSGKELGDSRLHSSSRGEEYNDSDDEDLYLGEERH